MSVVGCLGVMALCGFCWATSIYLILVRRFQNKAALLRYNWLVLILMLINLGICLPVLISFLTSKLPFPVYQLLIIVVATNTLSTGGLIAFAGYSQIAITRHCPQTTDFLVVLGAATHEGKVPPVLATRLMGAWQYWQAVPQATIIVTGGTVHGEPIAEATAMAFFLYHLGVPAKQIVIEDQAQNSWQNLRLSAQLIDKREAHIVVITSDFHVFRIRRYLRRLDLNWQVCGVATPLTYRPLTYVRDYLGNIRDHRKLVTGILIAAILLFELLLH